MSYTLFFLGQILLIVLVGFLLWRMSKTLRASYQRFRIAPLLQRRLLNYNMAFLLIWLATLAQLAWLGFFMDEDYMPFRLLSCTLIPVIGGLLLLKRKGFQAFLKVIPLPSLILIQTYRIPLEIIQWLGFEGGYVPVQMTFVGLNYDIMVGLSAILAGSVFFRNGNIRKLEAMIWNLFGLVLLLNMQVVQFFSVPSPYQVWNNDPGYWTVGTAPWIWIPGFLTPLGILAHIYSLYLIGLQRKTKRQFQIRKTE